MADITLAEIWGLANQRRQKLLTPQLQNPLNAPQGSALPHFFSIAVGLASHLSVCKLLCFSQPSIVIFFLAVFSGKNIPVYAHSPTVVFDCRPDLRLC